MSMNLESLKARIHNDLQQTPNREMTADTHNALNEQRLKVMGTIENKIPKRDAIVRDRSLSDDGQRTKIAALATDSMPEFAHLERVVDRLDKAIAETPIFSVLSPIKDLVRRELRNGEIRDTVRGLDENERGTQFLIASQLDHDEVLDAMLDAPGGPLVSAEMKQRALNARAQRKHPVAYAQHQQNLLLRDAVKALLEHVALCLAAMGVDPRAIAKTLGIELRDLIEEKNREDRNRGTKS